MNKDALNQLWTSYLNSYGDVSPSERERLLRQSVSDDIAFTNPGGEGNGIGSLMRHIADFQTQLPGARFEGGKLLSHHDELLSEWTLYTKDGKPIATAHTYARFNEEGRLTYTAGFFDPPQRP